MIILFLCAELKARDINTTQSEAQEDRKASDQWQVVMQFGIFLPFPLKNHLGNMITEMSSSYKKSNI